MSLSDLITARAIVLLQGKSARSPIHRLMDDDPFCTLMMRHRMEQGVGLPEQDPGIPPSARLALLHALAAGEGVAEARERCDGRRGLLAKLSKAREISDGSIRDILVRSMEAMLEKEDPNSHWAAQYLLYGAERILQSAIALHESDTSPEAAAAVVGAMMRRPPDTSLTITDRDPVTGATGFIRIGRRPAHFGFPETGSPKTGTNAAILHYEIEHPGGAFCLFTDCGGPIGELMGKIHDACPLYINDPHQLMALNSYWLREMGAFCVPCGDTQITFLDRDGVVSASEYPDFRVDVDRILAELSERGLSSEGLNGIAPYLRGERGVPDHDYDLIDRVSQANPDLLGYLGMQLDRSQIFGIPLDGLRALATGLCDGDEARAEAAVTAALTGAAVLDMPAGPLHLYVPNIASPNRSDEAEPLLNAVTGRKDGALMFLLADRPLDIGPDPHAVTTMRRVLPAAPGAGPEPG